ncbi:hypothetical protein Spa11_36050 [Botrimarina mediterranea]|uniref:Uncharacterized protein n=2 Tax=Botrimarina mediterranea TaxID=2528022 RepID=A0A518KC95_9BACT|nr:hypothetical protein Spa11_36050 [Botrimarina mediterranea]
MATQGIVATVRVSTVIVHVVVDVMVAQMNVSTCRVSARTVVPITMHVRHRNPMGKGERREQKSGDKSPVHGRQS